MGEKKIQKLGLESKLGCSPPVVFIGKLNLVRSPKLVVSMQNVYCRSSNMDVLQDSLMNAILMIFKQDHAASSKKRIALIEALYVMKRMQTL